ncbi:MAG: CHASE4 domain-containing protein [Micropepsaceae bacterium]
MRLYTKIALTLSLTAIASSMAAITTVSAIFVPQYERMDRAEASDAAKRVYGVFQRELEVSKSHTGDWGNWDDTYKFALDFNKAYVEANLTPDALNTIGVTELLVAKLSGQITSHHQADPKATARQVPFAKIGSMPTEMWQPPENLVPRVRFAGVVATPYGPAIAAYTRITDSKYEKSNDSVLVLVKPIDAAFKKLVEEQSGYRFSLLATTVSRATTTSAISLTSLGTQGYSAEIPILNPAGRASYVLQVKTPATFSALATNTMKVIALLLLLIGIATGTALVVFMRRVVANPIEHMISHAQQIAKTGNLDSRLDMRRNDEIGSLAGSYDNMLGQLKQARLQIQEMSYVAGMANTAADVLHNIRNTLGPIATTVWKGREALKDLKTGHLARAGEELGQESTDPERRSKLAAFVTANATHIESSGKALDHDLSVIQDFAAQIENVLLHHESMSKGARVTETVPVAEILESATTHLRHSTPIAMQIKIAGDTMNIPPVLAQRVVLRQVMENLIMNAVQSIELQKPTEAQIVFSADCIDDKVELSITDNGAGIAGKNLKSIFERGVTTKGARGRGLGLHFCATSIRAMNGDISVESAGAGHGATFRIRLPKSSSTDAAA